VHIGGTVVWTSIPALNHLPCLSTGLLWHSRSPAERVDIVAHSYGGVVTSDLASDCDVGTSTRLQPASVDLCLALSASCSAAPRATVGEGVRARVQRVAFTDAVHSVERLPAIVQDWIYDVRYSAQQHSPGGKCPFAYRCVWFSAF